MDIGRVGQSCVDHVHEGSYNHQQSGDDGNWMWEESCYDINPVGGKKREERAFKETATIAAVLGIQQRIAPKVKGKATKQVGH